MSLTETAVQRFWKTMAERYGSRWFESYGDKPTTAWRDCIDPFSPKDIGMAIECLSQKDSTRQYPPTEPEFRALLQNAARGNAKPAEDPAEFRRGYWRSTIIHAVATQLGYSFETFEPVLIANKFTLGRAMRELLDEVDALEIATGQRTPGQEQMVDRRCHEIVAAFTQLRKAA